MLAVVGLGNPGKNYEKTIHNMGYMVIDHFAENNGLTFSKTKYFGKVAEGMLGQEKIILLKPETYMNLSGKSVEDMIRMLKLKCSEILVISDDIDLPFGELRVRGKGSAGTHNGLRDIVAKIGQEFPRLRIGVGRPENMDLATFVLSKLSKEKLELINEKFDKTDKIIELFIKNRSIEGIDISRL